MGGPHAEIMALQNASERGLSVQGATVYVTLEPCCHFGRTGPCCDALISAGIRKVIACIADPNPVVSGQGFARLAAAGIEVVTGPGAKDSREINIGFFSRMVRNTPWVRLKVAASLDGKTALRNGVSQWITSPEARTDGHQWRAQACAILTGIGTVKADDPRLDVRISGTTRQPRLVVIDSRLETPPGARLFSVTRSVLIYSAVLIPERKAALESRGAIVVHCPGQLPGTEHRVDLKAMFQDLARREVNEVHVEAGSRLNGALLQLGLVDELITYFAPKLIGDGFGFAELAPLTSLNDAISFSFSSVDHIGPDLRIVARRIGADVF